MCMCGRPTINGEPGYSWDGKTVGVRPPDPPPLADGDTLLFDEPGRCGGLDSHCHHFRIVRQYGMPYLLVRHGGGNERIRLHGFPGVKVLEAMDSTARYWTLQLIYHVQQDSARAACDGECIRWTRAAVEKRIRFRRRGRVRVEIIDTPAMRKVPKEFQRNN